ncbi:hypothetical protein DYB32_005612 [Aphanomyces invadans]|uniref:GH18 domain-containing protein n=1 Tax=Aphanomyces invadans TaxID=157072 RepID=A0A418AU06_9STRA|nr:hypothetical protein DYB32_005612 [Aphanomyces invadans]
MGLVVQSHDDPRVLPFVHRFSMNAYDYSSMGPNAPLPWLKATLEALKPLKSNEKFLIGLAFYGYDTRGTFCECFFRYPNQHVVYYPCLQSIQDRLELYTSAQTGAAVWDIGQGASTGLRLAHPVNLDCRVTYIAALVGLDYFFDLL